MVKELPKRWRKVGGSIFVSVLLHVVVLAVFLVKLPVPLLEPEQEQAVTVDLVPPPEETQAEETKPEEPLPAPEAKVDEPPEQEAIEEQPPPEPEQKPEEPEPAPPVDPEVQNEAKGKEGQPLPVLRPVFEFGEKDGGPKKSETGNASAEVLPLPAEKTPNEDVAEAVASSAEGEPASQPAPADPVPADIDVPQIDLAGTAFATMAREKVAGEAVAEVVAVEPLTPETDEASAEQPVEKPTDLTEAKTLFSENETDNPVATLAMGSIPRGERGGQLCATELREQLRHAPAQYRPEILPAYKLGEGTVLEAHEAAFRASSQWYGVSFRCELDKDVTKVMSFAFDIGEPIPRSEWKSRGFPAF